MYHARLITLHVGGEVTDDLDKEIAVDLVYLGFQNAPYLLQEGRGG